jgi:hypothetical protein
MPIDKFIKVVLGKRVIKYYENLGYEIPRYKNENNKIVVKKGSSILVKFEDISKGSQVELTGICDKCNNPFSIKAIQYFDRKNNNNQFLCNRCYIELPHIYTYLKSFNEIGLYVKSFGYKLITKELDYKNTTQLLIIQDKDKYCYKTKVHNLKKYIPNKFSTYNPYTIYNIKLWCKLNNKPYKLNNDQTYKGNKIKLKWQCLKEECGEIFESCWNDISTGHGCGVCDGHQVGLSNCLAIKNPELVKEWHPTKNGNLTPFDVTPYSGKYVWWQCNKGHEWYVSVRGRNFSKTKCPYCLGILPSKEYNLMIYNPKLASEWNYKKNIKTPEEYTPGSSKKVWWKCKECGREWPSVISSRNKGNGCPQCSESKGEIKIRERLQLNNIYYISQKEFEGLIGLGNGLLSYDFYLPKYNLLIEYQGEQHEKYIPGFHKSIEDFEKQQEHDKRKREYAKEHKIKLLEIWYYDFDNIEEILNRELNILITEVI